MRILLLNQTFPPDSTATAQHLADLALHLRDLGHHVVVISDGRDYERRDILYASRENWNGIAVHRLRTTAFGKSSFAGRFLDGVTYLVMAAGRMFGVPRPDLVVSFSSPPLLGLVGTMYARAVGARPVQWLMDLNIDAAIATGRLTEESLFTRLLLWALRFSLAHSEYVIVEDRYTAERAVRRGARPEAIVVIPPWPAHDPLPDESAARAAFRIAHRIGDEFVVMFSGNHAAVHPLDTLLHAARKLDGQGFLFLYIGSGERVRDVTEAVRRHALRDVRQLPLQPRERLAASLAAADLHVVVMGNQMNGLGHPSKFYGVLATGTPYVFIGPKASFAGDILCECPYGFAVEHGDVDGLVAVLRQARALGPQERQTYREANTAYLARRFGRGRSLAIFDGAVLGFQTPSAS